MTNFLDSGHYVKQPPQPAEEAQALQRAYALRVQELAAWHSRQSLATSGWVAVVHQQQAAEFYATARKSLQI